VQADAIAEQLWPGRVRAVDVLGGGITNRNLKVTLDDGTAVVLRIGGKDTGLLGIDRRVEHEASSVAAAAGIAPEVVAFVEPEGYLVTRFVEGGTWEYDARRLADVLSLVRRFHDGPRIGGRFDSFRVVEAYCATAAAHGVRVPPAYEDAKAVADRIEKSRGRIDPAPCHNDLLNANFIDSGTRVWIVDWEYAGMGDRFFDLANFSVNHELGDADNDALLREYFGATTNEHRRALVLMRFMSDFREAMWGVVQQGISELDFDFAAYADKHFERLERTASDPEFQAALGA
jgi:thiamine kinase-like enzyme